MASLVERTRLAVRMHKQSFSNLVRQNGRRVTKVYYVASLLQGVQTHLVNVVFLVSKPS